MMNFGKDYWDQNYAEPQTMDGIGNAKLHAKYLHSLLSLEHIDISSIIDYGMGYGVLFKEMIKTFRPHTAVGLEPSTYAFKKVSRIQNQKLPVESLNLHHTDMQSWLQQNKQTFDLGICTSVFQYIPDDELKKIITLISKQVKYLYLTVPTNKELLRQIDELDFHDRFAIKRSRQFYQDIFGKHFTFISSRFLESKFFFKEKNTFFTDLLFRF